MGESAPSWPFPDAEWLAGADPREVLRRLQDGDPLELRHRCSQRTRAQAYLLDAERLFELAAACVAGKAHRYDDAAPLAAWLDERVDEAIRHALRRDEEDERAAVPAAEPWDPRYVFFTEAFGIEAALARRAAVVFNGLPPETRKAFFAIAVEGKSIDECIELGYGPAEELRTKARTALTALSILGDLADFESDGFLPRREEGGGDE